MSIIEASTLPRGRNMYRKPQTNADRIRAMSDEELARKFAEIEGEPYRWISIQSWLEWLKQEAEDG